MNISLKNLGTVNKNMVRINDLTIYFSYETPVGYSYLGELIVRENDWSVTTGKFLNELQADKSQRISGEQFEKQLNEILSKFDK